jgi:3-deoxy-D-manno-octulosonic-acid transferase
MASRPIIIGPHMENFPDIARSFLSEDALVQVSTPEDLGREVASLMLDETRRRALGERAHAVVERNRGALQRTVDALTDLIA